MSRQEQPAEGRPDDSDWEAEYERYIQSGSMFEEELDLPPHKRKNHLENQIGKAEYEEDR